MKNAIVVLSYRFFFLLLLLYFDICLILGFSGWIYRNWIYEEIFFVCDLFIYIISTTFWSGCIKNYRLRVCVYVCVCKRVRASVCVCVLMNIFIHTQYDLTTKVYQKLHMYVRLRVCTCVRVCIYVCICHKRTSPL